MTDKGPPITGGMIDKRPPITGRNNRRRWEKNR
jgi:hypothetical protein